MNIGKRVHMGENEGTYEALAHQIKTQKYMHSIIQFGLYSIFRADTVERPTTFS